MSDAGDARSELAKGLDGFVDGDQIKFLIEEVLAITKRPWADVKCKGCGKGQRVQVDVPDAKAVAGALGDLLNQAKGRPDVAAGADDEQIVFERAMIFGCDTCQCGPCRAARGETDDTGEEAT